MKNTVKDHNYIRGAMKYDRGESGERRESHSDISMVFT